MLERVFLAIAGRSSDTLPRMPTQQTLVIGSAPGCDIVLQGPDVAPRHAMLSWRDGLILQDAGQGRTLVDGRMLAPGETVQLAGFHANVLLGSVRLPLTAPQVSRLFVDRSALPIERGAVVLGRDPGRAHLVVGHPTVSGAHVRFDLAARTVTDLGSRSGTFDRNSQRLPANQPVPLDMEGGYFLGMAWVPTATVFEMAGGAQVQSISAMPTAVPIQPAASPQLAPQAQIVSMPSQPSPLAKGPFGAPPSMPGVAGQPGNFASIPSAPGVSGPMPPVPGGGAKGAPVKQRTMFGTFDLAALQQGGGKREAIIGRLPTCDIVLPYPQLSGRHASVTKAPDGNLLITDLGSTNGTYVNGTRLVPHHPVSVAPGSKIFVGPYPMIVDLQGESISAYIDSERSEWSGNLVEIEALDLFLKVQDRDDRTKDKVLLNHITFKARPGDLIALMGPSGAGKTTLLTVLNGYLRPTSGQVRINGEDLYAIYDALRGSIGYVPQDDIVHPELTVWEAIKYSAQFRLPPDYSEEEINRRVEQTIKDLGLEQVKNLEIGKPERKVLSGGQRKRVNIALELVTDPALMFLDEPTSGLAADDTVALIDLLSGLAKKTGKTIIVTIHQPAREEYEKFNLALIMGFGGELVYYGPTGKESYDFFGRYAGQNIDNPRDMFDQLKAREEDALKSGQYPNKPAARLAAAQAWRAEYHRPDNATYRKMYSGAREPGKPGKNRPPSRAKVPLLRQFGLLLRRYATVKKRDKAGTAILLAQAPIIGGLLALVFNDPTKTPNMWCRMTLERLEGMALQAAQQQGPQAIQQLQQCMQTPGRFQNVADFGSAIFFLVVAAIWFGTSNAAREIVAEQAIYRRERMVNLSIFNYIMSKFVLLSGLCIVQCTVLLGIVYPVVGLGGGSFAAFLPMLGMLILTAMCAVAIGLLLSTVVVSSEAAMALTPIALIPQVVLGGRMVPMTNKSWLEPIMAMIPARWSFEGVLGAERDAVSTLNEWRIRACTSGNGIENGIFQCALQELSNTERGMGGLGFTTFDQPAVAISVLSGMTLLVLILVGVLLKRRDSV